MIMLRRIRKESSGSAIEIVVGKVVENSTGDQSLSGEELQLDQQELDPAIIEENECFDCAANDLHMQVLWEHCTISPHPLLEILNKGKLEAPIAPNAPRVVQGMKKIPVGVSIPDYANLCGPQIMLSRPWN